MARARFGGSFFFRGVPLASSSLLSGGGGDGGGDGGGGFGALFLSTCLRLALSWSICWLCEFGITTLTANETLMRLHSIHYLQVQTTYIRSTS